MRKTLITVLCMGWSSGVFAAPATWVQSVTYNGETITMQLTQQDLRGSNFELWAQNATGGYDVVAPVAERSYLGTVDGYPGAVSCGVLKDDGTTFWGAVYFDRGATWFTLGSAVTSTRGTTPTTSFNFPSYTVTSGHAGSVTYGFDVGIDANYEYYTTRAGSNTNKTFEMIEYSVALTRALYIRDALLRPYLGRVIIRTSQAHDPEQGHTTDGAYLTAMTTEWNTNHADSNFDLVAGIATTLHDYGGLASSGYSVNGSDANGNFSIVWRHEMGHNWSLGHYDGGNPEGPTINSGNAYARMSGPEVERALNRRDDRMAIIDAEGSFGVSLPPYAGMDSGVFIQTVTPSLTMDVLANDHDANGEALSLSSYDGSSANGGTVIQQGQNLVYTASGVFSGTDHFMYTITDTAGRTAEGVVILSVEPNDPLRLYLPLDETSETTAVDQSVFENDGTLSGTEFSASVAGKYGNAIDLDGVDDHVEVSNVKLTANTVTITAWVKQGATQNAWAGMVLDRSISASGLNIGEAEELRYHWNGGQWSWNSGLTPPADTWTFVALVVEPSKATLYMNSGSGFQTATNAATHAAATFGTTYVGWDTHSSPRHFRGAIDEVRIYNYAMSSAELQGVYEGGGAESPSPFDGAADVESFVLRWSPSATATAHEVYIGTNQTAVANATQASPEYKATTSESFFIASLADQTPYYWRIDTVTDSTTLPGSVWAFTTGTVQELGSIISVDFGSNAFSGGELIGPLATDSTYWNEGGGNASGSLTDLADNIGMTTGVGIQWQSGGTWGNGDGTSDDQHKLAQRYLDDGNIGGGKGATVTISNIPYTVYKVYGLFATDQNGSDSSGIVNFKINGTWALGGSASTTASAWGGITANHAANSEYWTEIDPGTSQGNYWTVVTTGATCTIVGEDKNGSNRGCLTAVIIEKLQDTDGDGNPDDTDLDDDNDGIPDDWEIARGLDPLTHDASGHSDLDPYDNWFEYVSDTDPLDGNSWQTFSFEIDPGTGNPIARFSTSASRRYTVWYRTNLVDGVWQNLGTASFLGTGSEMTVSDSASEDQRFYRLRIQLP